MAKAILVYADWAPLAQASLIGELHADLLRGREIFSFEYDTGWLKEYGLSFFDPDLSLFTGRQFVPQDKNLFGVFTDSCPDRWGRLLMKRREAIQAREAGRPERKLTESDFLLGIQDIARTGALRFKTEKEGAFLADSSRYSVPVWAQIRELEDAAFHFDAGDGSDILACGDGGVASACARSWLPERVGQRNITFGREISLKYHLNITQISLTRWLICRKMPSVSDICDISFRESAGRVWQAFTWNRP